MNIGILGGTFDPPHIGHLIIADQALVQLQLDEVWFMPVGQPPHKVSNHITPIHHRVAMVNLAIADHQGFRLSLVDVERPAPHYSSDYAGDLSDALSPARLVLHHGRRFIGRFTALAQPKAADRAGHAGRGQPAKRPPRPG